MLLGPLRISKLGFCSRFPPQNDGVGVTVGVFVRVLVGVFVMRTGGCVLVGVPVGGTTAVAVRVGVRVAVRVAVGVLVSVLVGVLVDVLVGVDELVRV